MAADEQKDQAEIITVGKVADDNRAIWDRHPFHPSNYGQPEGEVFISDMRPYEVHRSPGIMQKFSEKALRELGSRDAEARRKASEEAEAKREEQRAKIAESASPAAVPAVAVPPVTADVDTSAEEAEDNESEGEGENSDNDETPNGRRFRRSGGRGATPPR